MKKIVSLAFALLLTAGAAAQTKKIDAIYEGTTLDTSYAEKDTVMRSHKGVGGINLSQTSLSNWAAGGDPSIAGDALFNYSIDYQRNRTLWQHRLELAYGLNRTKTNGTRKTNDKIYLNTLYGYKFAPHWYLTAFANFQSQFAKGVDYTVHHKNYISKFMAPGYLSLGPGIMWKPKPWFSVTLSPATWRGTFVLDKKLSDAGAFGVTPGKHLLNEFGAVLKMEYQHEIMTNMNLYSRLVLFSNYLHRPQNIDIHWDNMLSMKINRFFSANLSLNMVYDDDIKFIRKDGTSGARLQFKEVFGIGFMYNF